MADYLVTGAELTGIADKIRDRAGSSEKYNFPFSVNEIPRPYGGFGNGTISRVYFNTEKLTGSAINEWMSGISLNAKTILGQITVSTSNSRVSAVDSVSGKAIGTGYYNITSSTGNYFQWVVPYLDLETPYAYSDREGILGTSVSGSMNKQLEYMMFSSTPAGFGISHEAQQEVDELAMVAALKTTHKLDTAEKIANALLGTADADWSELDFTITNVAQTLYITVTLNQVIIDWGDGNVQNVTASGGVTHTYSATGDYTVRIFGNWSPGATVGSSNYGLLGEVKTQKAGTFPQLTAARLSGTVKERANGFFNCTMLKDVVLLGATTSDYFEGCTSLTNVVELYAANSTSFSSSLQTYVCGRTAGTIVASGVSRLILPQVEDIKALAAPAIKKLTIPSSCTNIQETAINAPDLQRVDILGGTEHLFIGSGAFIFCTSLTDVYLYRHPNDLIIRNNVFFDNSALTFHTYAVYIDLLKALLGDAGVNATVVPF